MPECDSCVPAAIRPPSQRAYEIMVVLRGVAPTVWRKVVVPADVTLWELHRVLQHVFGWTESHLFEFEVAEKRYLDPWFDGPDVDDVFATEVTLADVLGDHDRFAYVYDMGDGWMHDVHVVREVPPDEMTASPFCTAGSGLVPNEDCGGADGWMRLVIEGRVPRPDERPPLDLIAVNDMLPGVIAPRPRVRCARVEPHHRSI